MPTVHDDPTQLNKKKHVGNDSVHVVWSECAKDYNPRTISGSFGDVVIVVYPLQNGMFRIQIAKKPKVPEMRVYPMIGIQIFRFFLMQFFFFFTDPLFRAVESQHGCSQENSSRLN